MDITETLAPRSDQLNADDLVAAPRTVTVVEVRPGSAEQPVEIVTQEFGPGRPYKPGKSMRRVLAKVWGVESSEWVGRAMTLYNDPSIRFGKEATGGIRISHMTGIDTAQTISLTVTRGKRAPFTVQPLPDAPAAPSAEQVANATREQVTQWWTAHPHLRPQLTARAEELKAGEQE